MSTEISIRDNGPILVSGDITLKDGSGNEYSLEGKANVALCRCGHSANKPFCDGAHRDKFESTCTAS